MVPRTLISTHLDILPTVTSLIARRETQPTAADAGSRQMVDPKTRGTVIHAWFECIEWLDGQTSMPDEALLRARASDLILSEGVIGRLLAECYAASQRPEPRRVFE